MHGQCMHAIMHHQSPHNNTTPNDTKAVMNASRLAISTIYKTSSSLLRHRLSAQDSRGSLSNKVPLATKLATQLAPLICSSRRRR